MGIILVILTGIIVVAISYILDHVWAATIPVRTLYYLIRAPGVILHECAHMAGCLLTGARIKKVVFFSRDGGSVTYTRPLVPYLGDVIISTAPLFVIPLVLSCMTWIFVIYLGCIVPVFPQRITSPESFLSLAGAILDSLTANLVTEFNGWFILYLYLTISLVLSAAPSGQDMRNAAIGIVLLALAGAMIVWSGLPAAVALLDECMRLLELGFSLGLVYGLIALLVSSPLILWYGYCRSR